MGNNAKGGFHCGWGHDNRLCWLGEQLVGSTAVEFVYVVIPPSVLRHAPLDILIYMARDYMI
jgi:hypothetical protein